MDNSNGHGGPLATSVHDSQTQADAHDADGQKENSAVGDPADAGEVEETWGDHRSYTAANRRTTPTREEVEDELAILSRGPFARVLADYLGFSPTPAALRRFADKSPDKWAGALAILADLSGYKKGVVEVNNIMMIGSMDDSALIKRVKELEQLMNAQTRLITSQEPANQPRELAPSRDPDIIDVKAKSVE